MIYELLTILLGNLDTRR